jgi:tRNA pseudouridine32 synthase/23S rRNA pseudouridine746 synthase
MSSAPSSSAPVLAAKRYTPPQDPLTLLYQDEDCLVFSKPSGLLSVPGKTADLADCMESRARALYPEALTIHRLDMETSGVYLMARHKKAQAYFGLQFERRTTHKTYIALVSGHPEAESGEIALPLRCDWPNRPRQMVCYEHGRNAQTHWRVLDRVMYGAHRADKGAEAADIPASRLELKPVTGRSHQLRVHCAAIGYPILGDPFYAPDDIVRAAPRLCLHAQSLTIPHPQGGGLVTFIDDCPF